MENEAGPWQFMSNDDYHSRPEWSSSALKKVYRQSVWHALREMADDTGHQPSWYQIGEVAHAMLENDFTTYDAPALGHTVKTKADICEALDAAGVEYKKSALKKELLQVLRDSDECDAVYIADAKAAVRATGCKVVDPENYLLGQQLALATALKLDRVDLGDLLPGNLTLWEAICRHGVREPSMFTTLQGVDVRIRPDCILNLNESGTECLLVSYKTARPGLGSPSAYRREYRKRLYDISDALYVDAMMQEWVMCHGVLNVVMEKPDGDHPAHPNAVSVYMVTENELGWGRDKYQQALEQVRAYEETGSAPGYPSEIIQLGQSDD